MENLNQRTVNILKAVFETAEKMAKATGMTLAAAVELMETGELRLNEFMAIKNTLGLNDDRLFFPV